MTALYFLCFFQVFLLFVVLNIGDKDILKPSSVIVVVFTISTTIALLYHKKWTAISNYSWFSAFLIASGNCTFIIVDALIYKCLNSKMKIYNNMGRINTQICFPKMLTIILLDLVILISFYRYMKNVVELYDATERFGTLSISSAYRELYGHNNIVSASDQMKALLRYGIYFLQACAYVCIYPFVSIFFIEKRGFLKALPYIVPISLFLIYGFLCGSRIDLIKVFISAFFIFCVLYMKKKGWKEKNVKNILKNGVRILLFTFVLFFVSSISVGRSAIGKSLTGSFFQHIAGYVGAGIVHFDQFVQEPVNVKVPGEESFTSLYIFLHRHGFINVNRTSHLEYRHLSGGIVGNIYTFFRKPLSDFGLIGMYVFTIIVSLFLGIFYYRYIKFAKYKSKDRFAVCLIIFSILFQWVALASINQLSSEIVCPAFLIKIILIIVVYIFAYNFEFKKMKLKIE